MAKRNFDPDDLLAKIGPLQPKHVNADWTMYSFNTPSNLFWLGMIRGLAKQGWSEIEIQLWLQSKSARWLLDGMGQDIVELGESCAKDQEKITE